MAMQQFFKSVEDIKGDMAEIRGLQRDVMTMHEKSKTIVKSKEMEKHRKDMQVGSRPNHALHAFDVHGAPTDATWVLHAAGACACMLPC
jgi:hypothetical protein